MSGHIQLVDKSSISKEYQKGMHWDCYLDGVCVGAITYSPGRRWSTGDYIASVFYCEDNRNGNKSAFNQGQYSSVYAAKVGMLEKAREYVNFSKARQARKAPPVYLPAADFQFYPTPSRVAGQLLRGVNWNIVKTVLEPSAGKGDLIECALHRNSYFSFRGRKYSSNRDIDVDCIEIDTNLQAILIGKGFRVVHDDFLSYVTRKRYDLILMNPPFSEGDLHLIRAIEMCENGGQIACILNAETIRNPYTNSRRVLMKKLKEVGASIRYVNNAFSKAERRSNVDVALVNVSIPYVFTDETIWEDLKKAKSADGTGVDKGENNLAPSDNIDRLIREHDLMCEAGIALMRTYNGIAQHIRTRADAVYPLITIAIGDRDRIEKCDAADVNKYLCLVRAKYWQELFDLPELRSRMTSEMQKQYSNLIGEMQDYEFSKFNIRQVVQRIMGQITVGVEAAILKCFEKLSAEHSYNENVENENIHYYNGWKSNKAHYVNMKCIIPTWGCFARSYKADSRGNYRDVLDGLDTHACFGVLSDLEKALDYLDKGETSSIDLLSVLKAAEAGDRTRNIPCKYFSVTFFKKGTCHIKFHDRKIVDRLNIYVGRNRSWLPPAYGKVRYEEMDDESRRVIDEFQGKEAYQSIMDNADDYLIDAKEVPLLTG